MIGKKENMGLIHNVIGLESSTLPYFCDKDSLLLLIMANEGADEGHHEAKTNCYDVFLSFRGQDSRYTFTGNLYNALCRKRIKTFFQDDDVVLNSGDQISPSTLKAIEESRISIIVFSKNYASSACCLEELVKIIQCKRMKNQLVWPIYYGVEPSEVRYQRGKFGEAMSAFEERLEGYTQRVPQWRAALSEVSNLAGWSYDQGIWRYEYELIHRIVELAVQSLPRRDIFLSFSGEDTRYSFTGCLYDALSREGFKAFMAVEGLVSGNEISQTLIEAIEKSSLSIVVFSQNYAYSSWCLDELVKIVECMKTKNQIVWPIFYKVEQSDVSNQTKSYGDAMTALEKWFGRDSERMQKWRSSLSEVANLKGEHLKENEYEYEFIERIVEMAVNIENH